MLAGQNIAHKRPPSLAAPITKAHPTGLCTYILILLGHALYGLPTMSAQMVPMFFAMKAKQRYPKNQIQSPS